MVNHNQSEETFADDRSPRVIRPPAPLLAGALAIVVVVVLTVLIVWIALTISRRALGLYTQELLWDTAAEVAERLPEGRGDAATVRRLFDKLETMHPDVSAYLLDEHGVVVTPSPDGAIGRTVRLVSIAEALRDEAPSLPLFGDDPGTPGATRPFAAAPLPDRSGYVYVISNSRWLEDRAGVREVVLALAPGLVIGLLVTLTVCIGVTIHLTQNFRRMVKLLEAYRAGRLREKVAWSGNDEISRLGQAISAVAAHVSDRSQAIAASRSTRQELFARVVHDLRGPLTGLRAGLDTLAQEGDRLREAQVRLLFSAFHRALGAHARLRESLSGLSADRVIPERLVTERLSIREVVEEVVSRTIPHAQSARVLLLSDYGKGLPLVSGDRVLLDRVFSNLVLNAVRHTPAGGMVRIAIRGRAGGLECTVQDTGEGIAAEDLPYLVDRFSGGARRQRPSESAAGLGLSIVQQILTLHRTSLEVESRQGEGSTFRFSLFERIPAGDPGPASGEPASTRSAPTGAEAVDVSSRVWGILFIAVMLSAPGSMSGEWLLSRMLLDLWSLALAATVFLSPSLAVARNSMACAGSGVSLLMLLHGAFPETPRTAVIVWFAFLGTFSGITLRLAPPRGRAFFALAGLAAFVEWSLRSPRPELAIVAVSAGIGVGSVLIRALRGGSVRSIIIRTSLVYAACATLLGGYHTYAVARLVRTAALGGSPRWTTAMVERIGAEVGRSTLEHPADLHDRVLAVRLSELGLLNLGIELYLADARTGEAVGSSIHSDGGDEGSLPPDVLRYVSPAGGAILLQETPNPARFGAGSTGALVRIGPPGENRLLYLLFETPLSESMLRKATQPLLVVFISVIVAGFLVVRYGTLRLVAPRLRRTVKSVESVLAAVERGDRVVPSAIGLEAAVVATLARLGDEVRQRSAELLEEDTRTRAVVSTTDRELSRAIESLHTDLSALEASYSPGHELARVPLWRLVWLVRSEAVLLDALFFLARCEVGEVRIGRERFVPGEYLAEALLELSGFAEREGITIAQEAATETIVFEGSRSVLGRVFGAMVHGAISWVGRGGACVLAESRNDSRFCLQLRCAAGAHASPQEQAPLGLLVAASLARHAGGRMSWGYESSGRLTLELDMPGAVLGGS